jgi:hypothetical protein
MDSTRGTPSCKAGGKSKTPTARPQSLGKQIEITTLKIASRRDGERTRECEVATVEKQQHRPRMQPLNDKIPQRRLQDSSRLEDWDLKRSAG